MGSVDNIAAIGVDGGGTQCRFALVLHGQRYDVTQGSANATSDLGATVETLKQGLHALAQEAGVAFDMIKNTPAFLGLAGVTDRTIAKELALSLPLSNALVEDDRRTAMVGALGAKDGCVMGIGTGSFFGRRAGGRDHLIGGWGLVLGDDASGGFIGRDLLRRTLQVADGLLEPSDLSRDVRDQFGSPADIVAFAANAKPGEFAVFAQQVVRAAQAGDALAIQIMGEGAQAIGRALSALGWQPGERICPMGGLAPHYAPYLDTAMGADLRTPEGTALDGALALAADMARTGARA